MLSRSTILAFVQTLRPESVIHVLYMALLYLRAPVTPMHLAGSLNSGELPFFQELRAATQERDPDDELALIYYVAKGGTVKSLLSFRP